MYRQQNLDLLWGCMFNIHSLYNTRHTIVFIAFLKYLIFSSFKNTINGSFAVKWLPGFFVFSCFPKDFMSRFLSQCRSLVQYFGSNEIRDKMFSMAALASLNSRNMKKKQDSFKKSSRKLLPYILREAE